MDTKKIKTAFTEAVAELEAETRSRQFPDSITTAAALEHVDHDVVVSWAQAELGSRSPQQLLLDAFENLTDADATSIINCLMFGVDGLLIFILKKPRKGEWRIMFFLLIIKRRF